MISDNSEDNTSGPAKLPTCLTLPSLPQRSFNVIAKGSRNLYRAAYACDVWRMAAATFICGWRYS